ncbi:MAG: sigma factor [Anaerolineales bacterium]|jgi:RNA polymerase sigma-70 factor (ECF subfamily)
MDDYDLLNRAGQGDADAFGKLFERHGEKVFKFLYERRGNDRMTAEDMTNEVFMRAWRSLPNYDGKTSPGKLFMDIAQSVDSENRSRPK